MFISIVFIEAIILIPSYRSYQQDQIAQIESSGLTSIQNLFTLVDYNNSTNAVLDRGKNLIDSTVLLGATIYHQDGTLLGVFGEGVALDNSHDVGKNTQRSDDIKCSIECFYVKWLPKQVGAPFIVEVWLDSSTLDNSGFAYIKRIIGLVLIIAAFVTIVTMIVLSRLVLSPILLLRNEMIAAGNDPKAQQYHELPSQRSDEIGAVFSAFNEMIRHQSENTRALHDAKNHLEEQVRQRTAVLESTNRTLANEVSERKRAEEQSRSLARFPEENTNPVLRVNFDGLIMYANTASKPLLMAWETEVNKKLPKEWSQLIQDILETRDSKVVDTPVGKRIFAVRLTPVKDAKYVNIYGSDISERVEYENQLRHLANYDKLTGLPNRNLFLDRLQQTVGISQQEGGIFAVLLVEMDGFKEINQETGRESGDVLRQSIAQRLQDCVPDTDTVARFSNNIFAIIHTGGKNISDAADIAQRVLTALSEPFTMDDDAIEMYTSVGISMFPMDGDESDRLVHLADLAMFRAKADHRRNSYLFYKEGMNEAVQERRNLLRDLKWAMKRDQLEIHYQPQISLKDNTLIGMEALLRWRHPEKGFISPGHFIPLAEESQLITPIGLWVLQSACQQNKKWQEMGLPHLKVAVNLSSVQFREPDLVESVAKAIKDSGLDPQFLELEITESVAMEGAEKTIATLESLYALGLSLSIDDFGTGYSSLSYLKRFPVSKIKIDQSFVRDLETASESAAICNAVIRLGHSLNLQVIAEGVETAEQLRQTSELGCDQVQGYYYSRPLDVDAFASFIKEWRPDEQ
ncbi:MAG: EAL domain-containing protein [Magnetococcales bacterium]|nr:EAL domain-containing protein [Magnetococcales bacterium]